MVVAAAPVKPASAVSTGLGLFMAGIIIFIIIVIVVAVIAVFVVKWIVQFLKKRTEFLYAVKENRLKLCSQHAQSRIHNFRTYLNIPLRLVNSQDGKLQITQAVGRYGGHYISSDGVVFIRFFHDNYRYIWFLPWLEPQLLIIPASSSTVTFNENEILVYAFSIDRIGNRDYFFPVLKDKDGKVIDLKDRVYDTMKSITMSEALTEFLETYPNTIKKAIDMNPTIRGFIKTGDQNVEIQTPNQPAQRQGEQR